MQIFVDENQLNDAITEARHAYHSGLPEGGSVRLGQADALLKMDIGLCRKWREATEAADPELINAPNNLRSFVLSYTCAKWLQDIEDQIAAVVRDQAQPLVSRPEVLLAIVNIVADATGRKLAREARSAA